MVTVQIAESVRPAEIVRQSLTPGRITVSFTMMDVIGHIIIWLIISTVTLGIGLFFWPYAAAKMIINGITIYDSSDTRVGKLQCQLSAGQQIGHIILWLVISVVTFGIGFPFYLFGVARTALNKTEIV